MVGKGTLVGTWIGRRLLAARGAVHLLSELYRRPESVGTATNNHLAGTLLGRLARPGTTFLDVGAHLGSVTADVRHADPTVNVIAFEAVPAKAAGLRGRFPGVTVHACAVGESDGEVAFFVNAKASGYSALGRGPASRRADAVETRVPMRRLDGLVGPAEPVDVMKVDVEGAELGVFRGGEGTVARCRPTIVYESSGAHDVGLGYTPEALWDWLDGHGYAVLVPNRVAHDGEGLSRGGFLESHIYPMRTHNYVAVAHDRRREVRDRARQILGIRA